MALNARSLQRARNIITGNDRDRTVIQLGYHKNEIEFKEGDSWTENGKTWIVTNGVPVSVSAFDLVKQIITVPLFCPNCKRPMHGNDSKFFKLRHKCTKCVVTEETDMKIAGTYQDYEDSMMKKNLLGGLRDAKAEISHFIDEADQGVFTEDGIKEDWDGVVDKNSIVVDIQSIIEKVESTM